MRMKLILLSLTLVINCATVGGEPPDAGPSSFATVQDHQLHTNVWPNVDLMIDEELAYLGSESFRLYDVSDAEIHVFADFGDDRIVDRLLWIQLEQVLRSSDHVYDYSRLPDEVEIAGLTFASDSRYGEGYSLDHADPEGDVAEVIRMVEQHGLGMPEEMMRMRIVTVDPSGKDELLAIYLENLGEQGVTVEDLDSGEIEWEDLALKLRRRLLRVVRSE